jgi:hypothetical protein
MAKQVNDEIEVGDLVTVVASDDRHWIGMVGVFDNYYNIDGKMHYVVIDPDHEDEFTYAIEIELYRQVRG